MKRNSDTIIRQVIKRCISLTLSLLLIVGLFAGCGKEKATISAYKFDSSATSLSSCHIAKTDKYLLSWDDKAKAVLFTELETGKVWSSISYDAYKTGTAPDSLCSSLTVTASNTVTSKQDIFTSTSIATGGGAIIAEKIKSGVRVTYYFDNIKISIPVEYTLRKDSLKVSIDSTKVREDGENYQIVSASIAPFLCSASNETEGAYLFVPSGTGALIYTKNRSEGEAMWSGEIYDRDYSCKIEREYNHKAKVRLPVFGVKDGNNGLFAIVEDGAESVKIEAQAGNERLGYSGVYGTVNFRSCDTYMSTTNAFGHSLVSRAASDVTNETFVFGFYPLSSENANYNWMAKFYQQYLINKGELSKSDKISNPYSFTFHGGTMTAQSVLGIPTEKLVALTTVSDVKEILEDITESIGISPVVRLADFGEKGFQPAVINGGKNLPDEYGSKKEMLSLSDYCKKSGINLFMDFDTVKFTNSGNGFSATNDAAIGAMGVEAVQSMQTPQMELSETETYTILGRDSLEKAIEKAVKKAEKYDISGISLSTLTKMAYSDYSNEKYYAKSDMAKDVINLIKLAKGKNRLVAASDANVYAAGVSDVIFDLEVTNGNERIFDMMVPFYQMVFAGYKPMYISAVNMADNINEQLMLAASTGMGVDFGIIDEFEVKSDDLDFYKFYSMVYEGNKEIVSEILKDKGYIEHYKAINGAKIDDYTVIGDVSVTTFSNGVKVYANHSAYDAESPIGVLKGYEYKIA